MKCTIVSDGSELLLEMKNEKEQPYIGMKSKLREIIRELYCEGYDEFYLNCEYGIPLWSAETICGLKIYHEIKLHTHTSHIQFEQKWRKIGKRRG